LKRHHHLAIWPALGVVVLDQATKMAVVKNIQPYGVVEVIPGFFNLVHVRNRGIAFGLLGQGQGELLSYLLVGATLLAVALMVWWLARAGEDQRFFTLSLSVMLGGAIGNLADRIRLGEVIDFLDFYVGSYHWPAFNVADSAITIGTLSLACCLLFRAKK